MNRIKNLIKGQFGNAPVMLGFNVVGKEYWRVRSIFAELGQSDTTLKRALKEGHGIETSAIQPDTMLFIIISQQQKETMKKAGIENPTWLQLIGTSEVISLSEAEAIRRYRSLHE